MLNRVSVCLGCCSRRVLELLDLAAQPPSNRFVRPGETNREFHSLRIGQCQDCALIQLHDAMPPAMVKSHFDWLTYSEPESHLDNLVEQLSRLLSPRLNARIIGLSYKDDSTLARFNRLGYTNTLRLDLSRDLGINDSYAGLESIQGAVTEKHMQVLASRHGPADLMIARHVLEHAHDPGKFLCAFKSILSPGGHLVLEMPNCSKFIAACDYSFIWEEHITYFSPATFSRFARRNDFVVKNLLDYPYPLENSLVAILTPGEQEIQEVSVHEELELGYRFAQEFPRRCDAIRGQLKRLRNKGQRIAAFGAGHLAVKFLNLFELRDIVECVIDDNLNKQGLRMPGSNLPILGSKTLDAGEIDLCLLSLSPESEKKMLSTKQNFLAKGGRFASIFELSPISLRLGDVNESY